MKDFFKKLKASDKMLHVAVSALCYLALGWISVILGIIAVVCVGLLKEYVYDKALGKGTFEVDDMYADVVGLVLGILIGILWIL